MTDQNNHHPSSETESRICGFCRHFHFSNWYKSHTRSCDAFEQIPLVIWSGENPHTGPFPGDQGITFEEHGEFLEMGTPEEDEAWRKAVQHLIPRVLWDPAYQTQLGKRKGQKEGGRKRKRPMSHTDTNV